MSSAPARSEVFRVHCYKTAGRDLYSPRIQQHPYGLLEELFDQSVIVIIMPSIDGNDTVAADVMEGGSIVRLVDMKMSQILYICTSETARAREEKAFGAVARLQVTKPILELGDDSIPFTWDLNAFGTIKQAKVLVQYACKIESLVSVFLTNK
jgi:hypothetical protein